MTDREWYKQQGICPMCKKELSFGNYVHCAGCLEKIALNNLKYIHKKEEYQKHQNEKRKIRYLERKKAGICTVCGRKNDTKMILCSKCHTKKMNYRRENEKQYLNAKNYGEAFRNRMEKGLCMYCAKPQVQGYKFCGEHLTKRQECARKMISRSKYMKKEVDGYWKQIKQKHLENIF